ncbi:MAG: hypothetical protein NTZ78_04060 [Candidatus Aureabacteria bacterium]|nr:hypothetical protein [Candidatus Auribacterota bacterium]
MKKLITVALGFMLMVGLSGLVVAGSLDSPGAPSAGSGMYTLGADVGARVHDEDDEGDRG